MTNEKKQIEEMANDIAKICPDLVENCCGQVNCVTHLTLSLSKIGYRKASDVAREIFADIEENMTDIRMEFATLRAIGKRQLAKIKEKYESEGKE
jgi:hypothetical protein